MKMLCRGDILNWFGHPKQSQPLILPSDISNLARHIKNQVEEGKMRYSEAFLATVVDQVAALEADGSSHDVIEQLRRSLIEPRLFCEEQFPYVLRDEHTLVLPQYNRLRVEQAAVIGLDQYYFLARDYRETAESDEHGRPTKAMFWRLFHFNANDACAEEINGISQLEQPQDTVAITAQQGVLYVYMAGRLFTIDDDRCKMIAQIDLPNYAETEQRVERIVVHNEQVWVLTKNETDDFDICCFDLNGKLVDEVGYVGSLVEGIWSSGGSHALVSNLLELRLIEAWGGVKASRDLKPYFDEYPYSGRAIAACDPNGRIFFSNGHKVLIVSADLSSIVDEFVLPQPAFRLLIPNDGQIVIIAWDNLTSTLSFSHYER